MRAIFVVLHARKGINRIPARKLLIFALVLLIAVIAPEVTRAVWVHSLVVNLVDADWTLRGEDDGDWAAYFASPAGDVNGDGLGDALIGAPMAGEKICPYPLEPDGSCPGIPKGQGVAYLVLGRTGTLAPDPLNLAQADASFLGCEINSMTARQLYTAGDVNGDGYDDILVSGWKCGDNYTGKAYLFLGRDDVSSWGRFFPVEEADASFLGENEWDFLSYYVATAGDVNADGYADFLITSTHHEYDEPCPPAAPENCTHCCNNFLNSSEVLDLATDTWTVTGELSTGRIKHATVLVGEQVLVAGGQNRSTYLASAELYNPSSKLWESTSALAYPRSSHSMLRLGNGKVLATGGQNSSGFLSSTELYDPSLRTWSSGGNMHDPRANHTMTLLADGRLLVVGGQNESGVLASSEIFDPQDTTWHLAGSLNQPRVGHTATLLSNGLVLVAGGQFEGGNLTSAELFDPQMGNWTPVADLNTARSGHSATILTNQRVLVAGGTNESGYLGSAELYDPALNIWEDTGILKQARTNHTAVLLSDGRVLITGGQNDSGSLNLHEVFSLSQGTWTSDVTHYQTTARSDHVMLPLPDGTILVAGGRNCSDFGKVYLILGRPDSDWGMDFDLSQADASFLGEAPEDRLGRSATGVGDVNGDGYADFLIGAISSDYGGVNAGQNYLFLGRATPGDPAYDPSRPWWGNDYLVTWADASFVGEAPGDESGRRVAWAGDVNGDGLDDMLMQAALNDYAALDAGISYLVLGRSAADWGMRYPLAEADASFVGENQRDQAGRRLSGAGDVNQDGYGDFLIGAPHNQDGSLLEGIIAGKAYLIYGRADVNWGSYFSLSRADIIYVGKPEIGVAGYDMANLDDFNGDGIDDYLIAAYGGRNNLHMPGEAYVLLGSVTPIPVQFLPDALEVTAEPLIRYTGEYWEPNGWQDIHLAELYLVELYGDGTSLRVKYDQSTNEMYLFDYQQGHWLGPCAPEERGLLVNQEVQLECKGSRAINDENHTLRASWSIRWLDKLTRGDYFAVYLRAVDYSGADSGWLSFDTWTLLPNAVFLPMLLP